ncbi:MAG: RNA polymerase sigma factor [Flavonifractor plautii]
MDRPCCGTAIISCVTTMRPRTRCRTRRSRAWSRRDRFRAGTNLEAWLYKLAYHACIDLLRQRRRQLFAPPPPSGYNPDYIGPELRAALSVLTLEERGLVFGRVMEGRSYEELSQICGPSAAALRKRYERARKKLALALSESELDEQKEVVP